MAKYSNVVEYNIITDVDTSGITKLQNELTKLKQSLKFDAGTFNRLGLNNADVDKSIKKINQLQNALTAAFNPKIGTLDLSKLNTSLQREHSSLQMIVKDWEQMGYRGHAAISSLSNALLSMNKGAVTVNTTLSKIANTFSNTVRWGITASIFQEMMSSIQGAVSYMKDLDESLTQIQMVTNSSKEDMRELAQYANNAAQALGSTTTDYTNAVKVFVQEGFSEKESKQYANLSTKLANVSEQNTSVTSDQITAFRNAFQLDYEQTVSAMDKVANVANNTASNVNELMTASQRAASVAQAVGSSQESFLAAIATIESVTRQSAEEIGNGLKTIYQRFADIKVSGTTDDGVDYGQYAKALKSIGVDVLDAAGEFKGMDQILKETQEVWSGLSDTMKIAVGEKVAGKFQYNRFAALMNNQAYYEKAYAATGADSQGMMDQMNEYYMESIEGRLNTLQAAGEQVMSTLFDQDTVEPIIEDVTEIVNGFNDLVDAAGGLSGVVQALGAIMLRTFSTQIAGTISNIANSISMIVANSRNANQLSASVELLGLKNLNQSTLESSKTAKLVNNVAPNYDSLSEKTREKIRDLSQQIVQLEDEKVQLLQQQEQVVNKIKSRAFEEKQVNEQELKIQAALYTERKKELELQLRTGKITKQQYDNKIGSIHSSLQELGTKRNLYRQIEKAVTDYNKKIAEGKVLAEQDVQEILRWKTEADHLGIEFEELNNILKNIGINSQNLNLADKVVGDITKTATFEARINSMIKGLSNVTSIAFGFSMISEAIKTCADESTTFEEKFNAIVMNGTMGLTMLLPSLISIAKWLKVLRNAWIEENLAKVLSMTTDSAFIINLRATVAALWTKVKALAAATIELIKYAAAQFLALPLPAKIAIGIAALTVAVVAGTKAWIDNYSEVAQASKEYEKQSAILTKTKRNYEDIQEKVEGLKQSIDSISEASNSLSNLTKGTKEWRDATRELNKEVLELLQTYPELAEYVSNKDGVLTIDQGQLENFYEEQIDQASHLNDINNIQQAKTLQAKNNLSIAEFSSKYGLSKEEIEKAISNGTVKLEGQSAELNVAFAQLQDTIQANNAAINTLNDSTGILSNNFTNYSTKETLDNTEAKKAITDKFATKTYDEYGTETGYSLDFSTLTKNQEFLDMVAEATGKQITGATDTSWVDNNVKFKTSDGSEFEYSTEELLELLADSKVALEAENEKLNENIEVYTAFGARYNEVSNQFVAGSGRVITSLEDLGLTTDELNAIEAFRSGEYNNIMQKDFTGSIGDFARAIKNGEIDVENFSNALLASRLKTKEADASDRLEALTQTNGIKGSYEISDGINFEENIKLTPEQAQVIMSKMMDQLNRSQLSDEEKLQLMDKIDFTMPVEDILANIQHAIDTGNIDAAFIDTTGLEDDSEHKTEVLKEYDIDESTLSAYKEQLQTTGALAEQQQELNNNLENAKQKFGDQSEEVKSARNALAEFDEESEDLAVNLAQTQKGLESLSNNMAKYGDILKKGDKTTLEYAEALGAVKKSLADTLNISEENLSNATVENNLGNIEALAAGDIEALNELRAAAGQDIVTGFYLSEDSTLTEENMDYLKQKAIEISSLDIEVNADINDQAFVDSLNQMLANGELTRDQVNEYLHGIGVEPHLETESVPTEIFSTRGMFVEIPMPFGAPPARINVPEFTVYGNVGVPKITAEGGSSGGGGGTGLRRTASPTAPSGKTGVSPNYVNDAYKPKGGSGGGGGGKGNNKDNQKKEKQKSEWDYLTDITNDLDRAAAIMERLAKLEDRLYGANRVSQLKTLQKQYQNRIKLLRQELKLEENHAKRLRNNARDENGNLTISGYAYRAGVNKLKFDAQNNLDNGREIEQALLRKVNQATEDYNNHRNNNDAAIYDEKLTHAKNDYDGFLKALSEYESTLGKIEDSQSEIQDYKEKIQDAADAIVDSIQEGIDDVLKAMDSQREFNRMYRNWQEGGNSYSHFSNDRKYYTEGLESLLSSNNGQSIFDTQVKSLRDRIKDVEDVFDINKKDKKDADDEKLSQQAAFENLQEATSNVMDSLDKMIDYYDSLLETIQEASDKMDELIDNRLKEFDRLEKYLDTRLDQLALLFGDKSYEEQAQLYNQKIAVNMEKMVSINTAIEQKQATVDVLEKLEASGKKLSTEERKELQDARDKVNELQEEQLDTESKLLQDISDKLKAQTSAEMNKLVNSLFNDTDVNWLSEQWEIATRNSEKYLDDYNRAFELQKLQLKFQEALNDSQNSSLATQQKIVALGDEYLTYLREKNNLSEYDVKHAQMQLDILQKQIALEDARNNKSQMQLQRNAAGNYDFVYAADEKAVNQAAEALLAAQQESYNLSKKMYLDTYQSAFEAATKTKEMVVQIATDASVGVEERTERIKFVLDNLNEYLSGSSVELGEISLNLYNSFVEAEQLIAEENQGNLSAIFEQMRQDFTALVTEINQTLEDSKETSAAISESLIGTAESTSSTIGDSVNQTTEGIASAFGNMATTGSENFGKLVSSITSEEGDGGHLQKIKKGVVDKADEIHEYISNTTLANIDKRFGVSEEAILSVVGDIDSKIEEAFNKIIGAEGKPGYLGEFESKTEETLKLANDSYTSFTENSIDYTTKHLGTLIDSTQDWKNNLTYLNEEIEDCAEEVKEWKKQIDSAINAVGGDKGLIKRSNDLQKELGGVATKSTKAAYGLEVLGDSADYATDASFNAADACYAVAEAADSAANSARDAADAYRDMASAAAAAALQEAAAQEAHTARINNLGKVGSFITPTGNSSSYEDYYDNIWKVGNTYNFGMASGGYTGNWFDNGVDSQGGKWAVLHQKELVLNATDTENMLSAIEIVRDIMSGINSLSSIGKMTSQNSYNDTIEQRVEINATFPGVTEAIEIKQALEQLADNAYQAANKYKY